MSTSIDDDLDEIFNEKFDSEKPEPPAPKEGCVCEYHRRCQPLDCPGGDLCFAALAKQNGRVITRAIMEMITLGICVCHSDWIKPSSPRGAQGVVSLPKNRREKTPRCACGMYFSNEQVRKLGLFSKSEWRRLGHKLKVGEKPIASVWRTVYWAGVTGGRISEVGLYASEQVVELRRRVSK